LIERGESAPSTESLTRSFPLYPVSTLKDGIDAMLMVNRKNLSVNALKAARVDLGTILTGIVTGIVLITQFGLSWATRCCNQHRASHICRPHPSHNASPCSNRKQPTSVTGRPPVYAGVQSSRPTRWIVRYEASESGRKQIKR
jgi:Uma2 family endonuclease